MGGPHFESVLKTLEQKIHVCFSMLVSRFPFQMFFGFECGCLGFENQAFGVRGLAKNNYQRNSHSHDLGFHFS